MFPRLPHRAPAHVDWLLQVAPVSFAAACVYEIIIGVILRESPALQLETVLDSGEYRGSSSDGTDLQGETAYSSSRAAFSTSMLR